jgi:hypothetical protein
MVEILDIDGHDNSRSDEPLSRHYVVLVATIEGVLRRGFSMIRAGIVKIPAYCPAIERLERALLRHIRPDLYEAAD